MHRRVVVTTTILDEEALECPADVDENDLVARFLADANEDWQCRLHELKFGTRSATTELTEEVEKLAVRRSRLANFVICGEMVVEEAEERCDYAAVQDVVSHLASDVGQGQGDETEEEEALVDIEQTDEHRECAAVTDVEGLRAASRGNVCDHPSGVDLDSRVRR